MRPSGAVGEYLDFAKFLQHVAVETFVAETDGFVGDYGMNNFYMYRPVSQKPVYVDWLGQERSLQRWNDAVDLAEHSQHPD